MDDRVSPLSQCEPVVGLSHRSCAGLLQYHAWPDSYAQMAKGLAAHCALPEAPRPGKAACGAKAALLRVHPQRLWLIGVEPCPMIGAEMGAMLDLSHARIIIQVAHDVAVPLLSRFIAMDLRPHHFAVDDVAITPLHRVSAVLWRSAGGINIFCPRSFARSLWEVLAEAAQRHA